MGICNSLLLPCGPVFEGRGSCSASVCHSTCWHSWFPQWTELLPSAGSTHAAPDHDTPPTMLDCRQDSSQCGMVTPQSRTAKLCRELCAKMSASQGLLSPICRTSTSNATKAELLKSSKTQITLVTVSSFYGHLASASGAWFSMSSAWSV